MSGLRRFPRRAWLVAVAGLAAIVIALGPLPESGAPSPSSRSPSPQATLSAGAGALDAASRPSELSGSPPDSGGSGGGTGPAVTGGAANGEPTDPARAGDSQAPAVVSAIVPGAVDRASLDLLGTYEADVQLSFDARRLDVDATILFTNTSGGPIDRVELNTIAASLGALRLDSVSVDGRPVAATVDDQTVLVPLGGSLPAGAAGRLRIAFRSTLQAGVAGSSWLFTRASGIVNAYRWLPWISRRTPFRRPNHGDPFVTAVSPRVTVRVTTDRPLVLATTGQRTAVDGLTQTFEARNVRDFTLTAAPDFRIEAATAGDVTVQAFTRPGGPAAATLLREARHALLRMGERLGAYPYPSFIVAQSAGGYGMESPGLIWVPTGAAAANLPYLVHHETAHQWFYGIVGSDQAAEPFADEAPADFVARHVLGQRRASRCAADSLDRSIYEYSAACYYETIYIQGGAWLDTLRRRMGDEAFWSGLRDYVGANRFGLGSSGDLLRTLDERTSLDLSSSIAARFPSLP